MWGVRCSGARESCEQATSGTSSSRASSFKAREISLRYTFPAGMLSGGPFRQISIVASGRDLFRITNYRGLDPEVSNFGSQAVGRSIDVAPFPPSRSFWLGFDLTL